MPLALLDPSFSIRRTVERYFRNASLRPRIAVEANSISALIDLVRLTDLATILPENVGSAGLSIVRMDPAFEPGTPRCFAAAMLTVRRRPGLLSP